MSYIHTIATGIRDGRQSIVELVEEQLRRIRKLNPSLNAFITVLDERAIDIAKFEDSRRDSSFASPLSGIPISVKDNIWIKGVRSTSGSKILYDFVAEESATVVTRLEDSGSIVVGTNNLHEFASGVTSINKTFGAVKNPWHKDRIAGGSSGGSAAAVAAGMSFASLGTDTSGSVRIPAALCGVVGLKPTYGRVSKHGVFPLSPSLDHVGILTRDCLDASLVLSSIAGHDEKDSASLVHQKDDYFAKAQDPVVSLKIAIPSNYFFDIMDEEVRDSFYRFKERLANMGASFEDVTIPELDSVLRIWSPIRLSEASAIHSKWMKSRISDYSDDVRVMLLKGTAISAVDYIVGKEEALNLRERFLKVFETFDAMICPATPIAAPGQDEKVVDIGGQGYDVYSALSRLTIPFNITGLPAMVLPVGKSKKNGLPLAMQLSATSFGEATLLRLGNSYEQRFGRFPTPILE